MKRERSVYEGVLKSKDALVWEMGEASAGIWIKEAGWRAGILEGERRVLVSARKV
jgi:hypothetical protein